ncbi:hypothetical protein HW555_006781 [Spodoptera exigua]|uniref:FP protein C-terminal domain-containing protein n=1 Tax=Spodoptera exigua TaxID=7107 RepID=A0A835GH99_SPOEX|nr:hypothetical protein HW555_006781 [Spodoptera exigua]
MNHADIEALPTEPTNLVIPAGYFLKMIKLRRPSDHILKVPIAFKIWYMQIHKSNAEIEKTVTYISKQYDDIIKDVDLLKKENLAQKDYISNLELKIQDIQQRSRTSSIEVRNVPPINNETAADLSTIIAKVGAAVGMPLDVAQLRDTYRLPGKEGTVRPIIAELSSVQIKNQLLSSVRNFNKSNPNEGRLNTTCIGLSDDRRPVYVAEYLPVSSRKLFYLAREFSKQKGYKYCWTSNGNIFIRKEPGAKQVLIRSEKTLKDLQSCRNALPQELTLTSSYIRAIRLGKIADDTTVKMVYFSLCQSVVQYCIPSWGISGKTYLLNVERAQRALIKVAYRRPFRYPTDQLYSDVSVLRHNDFNGISYFIAKLFHRESEAISAKRQVWKDVGSPPVVGPVMPQMYQGFSHFLFPQRSNILLVNRMPIFVTTQRFLHPSILFEQHTPQRLVLIIP